MTRHLQEYMLTFTAKRATFGMQIIGTKGQEHPGQIIPLMKNGKNWCYCILLIDCGVDLMA